MMRDNQLDNYDLLRVIANRGAMVVYEGEHFNLGMKAAIKVLYPEHILDKRERLAAVKRFHQESCFLSQMDSPNIVKLYDYREEDDAHYMIMELASGGSLARLHPAGAQLSFRRVRWYARHCGRALQYAHSMGLLHRDVKPGNFFLGSRDRILLGDFGLAIPSRGRMEGRGKPAVGGTKAYMAPEQAQGEPCEASDQYSLATMLFEWLTGCSPFDNEEDDIVSQRQYCPIPSLHALASDIPAAVEQVVMRGLEPSPSDRFGSVLDFVEEFEAAFHVAPARYTVSRRLPSRAATVRRVRTVRTFITQR